MARKRIRKQGGLPVIAITMGDPAGIGPEIVAKALSHKGIFRLCRPWVIGDLRILQRTARTLQLPLKLGGYQKIQPVPASSGTIPVLQAGGPSRTLVLNILKRAGTLALNQEIAAIVTAPIHKASLREGGKQFPGHTEFFADLSGAREAGMMMVGGPLKVMLVTTHMRIRDVPPRITRARVRTAIRLADRALKDYFGIRSPRIAVASLNPHAGEDGLFGDEERRVIGPAVREARKAGVNASPPLGADTAFRKALRGEYDAVVAMYHDQALIPIKTLAFGKAVNLTVGLPFVRTSVDHGTADDIAGKGLADPGSLIAAIRLAARIARKRRKAQARYDS